MRIFLVCFLYVFSAQIWGSIPENNDNFFPFIFYKNIRPLTTDIWSFVTPAANNIVRIGFRLNNGSGTALDGTTSVHKVAPYCIDAPHASKTYYISDSDLFTLGSWYTDTTTLTNVAAFLLSDSSPNTALSAQSQSATCTSSSCTWGGGSLAALGTLNASGSCPIAVANGGNHTCALLYDGTVKCWGLNSAGQLGNETTVNSITPVTVHGVSSATAIASGRDFSCALLSNGTIKCWGDGGYGELGNGANSATNSLAVTVLDNDTGEALTNVTAVSLGNYTSCAIINGGTHKCWGLNNFGQVGDGTTTDRNKAVSTGLTSVTAIGMGSQHSCAVISGGVSGTAKCWGYNANGQVGSGGGNQSTPQTVADLSGALAIEGGAYHTCALMNDGTVKCWGAGEAGQCGDGNTTGSNTSPVSVLGISTATAIGLGSYHSCARLSNGTVKCWGYNDVGQLGDGTTTQRNAPVTVSNISTATGVSAGTNHLTAHTATCAILSGKLIECWGYNTDGEIGDGTSTNTSIPIYTNF